MVTSRLSRGSDGQPCGWCAGEGAIRDEEGKLGADCPRCKGGSILPDMARDDESRPWSIGGGFVIDAATHEEAQNALSALERAGARCNAAVTIHIHYSDPAGDDVADRFRA